MNIIKTILGIGCLAMSQATWADHHKIGASLNKKEKIAVSDIPPQVVGAVKALAPDIKIYEAEKEYKHGNVYIDVEGKLKDGRDIEFDLLKKDDRWSVVEIQRDLSWQQLPKNVTTALQADSPNFTAKRIIESIQHGKDITVYEFYSRDADGKESRKEVKVEQGKAEVLKKEWTH